MALMPSPPLPETQGTSSYYVELTAILLTEVTHTHRVDDSEKIT